MYLDELDTVRFDVRNKDYESNYVFAQAAMMKTLFKVKQLRFHKHSFLIPVSY